MKEEIKAGLIITVAMTLLTISVIVIGGTKLFEGLDVYYTRLYDVTGLEEGSQVKLGGLTVGRVLSIKPPEREKEPILIEIGLKQDTPLYEGVNAYVSQVGFVGDIFLQLSLTNSTGRRLKVGETIPSIEQSNFNTMMAKAEELTLSLKRLTEDINRLFSEENINNTSRLIKDVNTLVVNTDSRLETVVNTLKALSMHLSSLLSKAESVIEDNRQDLRELLLKAKQDMITLERLINSLEGSSKNFNKLLDTAEEVLDTQNHNLTELIKKVIKTTDNLNEAIVEFNQRPWRLIYRERPQKEER